MSRKLDITLGQYSDKGRKEINQDFHGALIPDGQMLAMKGISIALADGISSSAVSQFAAQSAIKSFLTDYYCTSDSWTVKTAAQRVLNAANSWLYAETKRSQHAYDMDKGYVCTLSAVVLKSSSAHLFHVGDSRIYRLNGNSLEQLTTDHRTVLSAEQSHLNRAMGMAQNIEIDYQKIQLSIGDVLILMTDGVYENTDHSFISNTIADKESDLDEAARLIVEDSITRGSTDNLTIQIIRIEDLPDANAEEFMWANEELPPPPLLEARQKFDGYRILRELHANHRSHIYLAKNMTSGEELALKIPSIDLRGNADYLKRFMMEEWIARRLNSAHVLKAYPQTHKRSYLYTTMEFIEGQTLAQWMIDNSSPDLETMRGIIEQIAKGLRAFHRKEMVHQDLRPENILIDQTGTVKIIDFGSTKVAGVVEAAPNFDKGDVLGTLQYAAPEYFVGEEGTKRSDFFSLAVIAYQMLTKKLPFGTQVSKARTPVQQNKLRYTSAISSRPDLPEWVDGVLKKALHPNPYKRYESLSEFTADLRTPNKKFIQNSHTPLAERNPVAFWQAISLLLAMAIIFLLTKI
ncbi:MAG: bifunctional protein-serine/threonine kinase/phosphatase [Rhizobiaceae bacterium]